MIFQVPGGINTLFGKKSAKSSGKFTQEQDKYRLILTI